MRIRPIFLTAIVMILILLSRSGRAAPQSAQTFETYLPILTQQGPPQWIGPSGGAILDLAVDANNPNTFYAGTWGGGVYKSVDGGLTWTPSNAGLGNLFLDSLEVAPNNSLILYAGTYKGKIYKSVDAGLSWREFSKGIQTDAIVYSIAIDPNRAKRVYAGTRGISNNGNPPWKGVVYRSDNGGQSWEAVLSGVGGTSQQDWAYSVTLNPNEPNQVFAATHEHGVYRSSDFGESWEAANNGISDLTGRTIVVDPRRSESGTVYLGVFHQTGLFKSLNSGNSWTLKNNGLNNVRIYQMTIDPAKPDVLYLSTFDDGVLKSVNAGDNWFSAGLPGEIIGDVAVNSANHEIILSGTFENGLFRSTDGGDNWSHPPLGLNASTVTSLVVDPGNPQHMYASLNPGWLTRSTDGGDTWRDFSHNLPDKYIHQIVIHPDNPDLLFALTDTAGLFRCNLKGACWSEVGANLPLTNLSGDIFPAEHPQAQLSAIEALLPEFEETPENMANIQARSPLLEMVFAPSDANIAYLGTARDGIYRSTNGGSSWSLAGLDGLSVWSIAVEPSNPNFLYAATSTPGVVKISNNGGGSWIDSNLPDKAYLYEISLSTATTGTLYAATSKGVYAFILGQWSKIGLQSTVITSIALHPTDPNVLIAGTASGIFISKDGGKQWKSGPEELNNIAVLAIYFDPHYPDLIYICTEYHGILRMKY